MAPARFGPFEILQRIADGGMGTVYLARQAQPERLVALKVLSRADPAGAAYRRFVREARITAKVRHPNVVTVFEVGEVDSQPYFTMEFVEGLDLKQRMAAGDLDRRTLIGLVRTVAAAVHHVHTHGILHRDLKPANILVDARGEPLITDFGLGRDLTRVESLTASGETVGTPAYMAPEQARGRSDLIDERSDVYSLGAVLYEALVARPPFRGESSYDLLRSVVQDEPVRPRVLDPSIDRDVETICLKALSKQGSDRYASAADLAADLGRYLAGEPVRARPLPLPARLLRFARRRPIEVGAAVLALAGVLVAAVLGVLWYAETRARESSESRSLVESSFRAAQEALASWHHANVFDELSALVREDPWPEDLAQKLLDLGNTLRRQRALPLADWVSREALRAADEAGTADLRAEAIRLRVAVLADLGRFAEAYGLRQQLHSVRPEGDPLRFVSLLGPHDQTVNLVAQGVALSGPPDIAVSDLDGDGREEVVLFCETGAAGPAEVRVLGPADWRPVACELAPPEPRARAESVKLMDANGDGADDLLVVWHPTGSEYVVRLHQWNRDRSPGPARFSAITGRDRPERFLSAELDGQPGHELVVACAPESREVWVYRGREPGGFPDPDSCFPLDAELPTRSADVEVLAALDATGDGVCDLLVGTAGHELYELRTYVVGCVPPVSRVTLGRVTALVPTEDGPGVFSFISDTPEDPLLVENMSSAEVRRLRTTGLCSVRVASAGSLICTADVDVPRTEMIGSVLPDNSVFRDARLLRAGSGHARILGYRVDGDAAFGPHSSAPAAAIGFVDLTDPHPTVGWMSTPGPCAFGDVDGDGDDEVLIASRKGVRIAGLQQGDDRSPPLDELIPGGGLLQWNELLDGLVPGGLTPEARRTMVVLASLDVDGAGAQRPELPGSTVPDAAFAAGRFDEVQGLLAGLGLAPAEPSISFGGSLGELAAVAAFFARPIPRDRSQQSDQIWCLSEEFDDGVAVPKAPAGWEGYWRRRDVCDGRATVPEGLLRLPSDRLEQPFRVAVDFLIERIDLGASIDVGLFAKGKGEPSLQAGLHLEHVRPVLRPSRSRNRIVPVIRPESNFAVVNRVDRTPGFPVGFWLRLRLFGFPRAGLYFVDFRAREWDPQSPAFASLLAVHEGALDCGSFVAGLSALSNGQEESVRLLVDRVVFESMKR